MDTHTDPPRPLLTIRHSGSDPLRCNGACLGSKGRRIARAAAAPQFNRGAAEGGGRRFVPRGTRRAFRLHGAESQRDGGGTLLVALFFYPYGLPAWTHPLYHPYIGCVVWRPEWEDNLPNEIRIGMRERPTHPGRPLTADLHLASHPESSLCTTSLRTSLHTSLQTHLSVNHPILTFRHTPLGSSASISTPG